MDPIERFSDAAKTALVLAQEEAERAHHSYIGSEHLLLGVLREGAGGAAVVLRSLGVEIKAVRSAMEAILGRNEPIIIRQLVPTARLKKVIELSLEEARSMGAEEVGTEHLLLGLLIEGEGLGAHLLQDLGVRLENVRDQLSRRPPSGLPVRPVPEVQQLAGGLPDDPEAALSVRSSGALLRWPPSATSYSAPNICCWRWPSLLPAALAKSWTGTG